MGKNYKMTMKGAIERINFYGEIFSRVRLIDESMAVRYECGEDVEKGLDGCMSDGEGSDSLTVENCVVIKAFSEKKDQDKIELTDRRLYNISAKYIEIDDAPYVIEMTKYMEAERESDIVCLGMPDNAFDLYHEKLYMDALTGAYNRRYFEDEIKQMNYSAGVALIDLDDFKLCNDTYGHNAGDRVLKIVVSAIRNCIRKTDILIRYGGDEFVLILPDVSKDVFIKKLNQIQEKVQMIVIPDYSRLQLSVSIGGIIADDEPIGNAIARADKLMYMAKTYRNRVVMEGDDFSFDGENGGGEGHDKGIIKQQILIVDDSEFNRSLLIEMLQSEFRILEAGTGRECIDILEQYGTGIDLILLDIVMPDLDGFEVLAYMNRKHWIEDIPVIMISSEGSEAYMKKAFELGVSDYISRPFDSKIVYRRVFNTIKLYAKQRRLLSLVADQIYEKEKNNRMMVSILSQIVEFRNGESGLHVLNINGICALLLERLVQKTDKYQLSWGKQYMIATASALHDIGKIGISEEILNKPGKLTAEEFEIMKRHSVIGFGMLKSIELYQDEELVKIAQEICRWHHERYDGNGYPDGLKGDEIPISAQVVSIADVYDALVSERVYKCAFTHEKAIEMIINGECGVFNPLLVECLKEAENEIQAHYTNASGGR